MKLITYMKQHNQFQRFVFYFSRFEITYNPKYDTPVFKSWVDHYGSYQMIEYFVKEVPIKEVEIDIKGKVLYGSDKYRIEYQGVFMY